MHVRFAVRRRNHRTIDVGDRREEKKNKSVRIESIASRSGESKFNNTAYLVAVRFLTAFLQPTYTIVSYSLLIYGPLISLTKFLGYCL